ncbi:hypothetical protein Q4Q35_19830 [Flavivirga aquimarina]|uniref:Uncharacterized protein n=1 Tax=Flavivirga aquimarina TaxID=2027862 RepID=A0ABT8WGE0_9FLAO|nr:hypothetical protein [Flavivirga aquimarina]MDO5972056.1 hypothetical protein [Flavivirga aquimarina]
MVFVVVIQITFLILVPIESLLKNINYLQLGLILGSVFVLIYFIARKLYKRKTYYIGDIIMSFAFGFTISMCFNIGLIGYFNECAELEYIAKACMVLGGFAIGVFAVEGLRKSIVKKDP